jgi:hypothetical protein
VNEAASGPLGRLVIVEDDPFLLEQLTWALKGKFIVTSARDATLGINYFLEGLGQALFGNDIRFLQRWAESIAQLDPRAVDVT